MKSIKWTEPSLDDLAALDKAIASRIKQAVERFARTGAGEYRLRVGDWRVRFHVAGARLTADFRSP